MVRERRMKTMITLGLCCRDVEGLDLEQQFEQAARLGFANVQIAMWRMEHLTPEHAHETKRLLEKYGLRCTEIWCGWTRPAYWDFRSGPSCLGLVPSEYRFQRLQDLLKGAAYARELGITDVITHLGFIPQDPTDHNYVGLIHALKHLTAELKKYDQFFSFETGQETPLVVRRCIEDVGADNLGVNYDPGNLLIYGNGNPVDGLDLLGGYVRSVHAKDATYPTSGYTPGEEKVMGEGQVDMKAFVEKLRRLGFDRVMSIEHERKGLSMEQKEQEIAHAKKYLEALL